MKKLLMLVPLVVLIIGCGGEEAGSTFFPLSVGNLWELIMTQTMTTPDTTMVIATGTHDQEITTETTLDDGTEVLEQIETMTMIIQIDTLFADTTVSVDTSYIQETEDYVFMYDDKTSTVPDTMIDLPIENGKTWRIDATTTAVVMGQESITVPAGTFSNCWKLGIIMTDGMTDGQTIDTMLVYTAENVGQVKMLMTETKGDTTMEMKMELENYTIK